MDRVSNRQTTWHLINIKARNNQTTSHYVEIFHKLLQEDPLIDLPREKCESLKNVIFSETLDSDGYPQWIQVTLLSYTIIDPDSFYNRRDQEDVTMAWDSDIVANKKESELYFIPSVHTVAVRKNSKISLNAIVKYFSEALNRMEQGGFDVDVVVDRDTLDRILNAHAVYSIEAHLSFSNPGHTGQFISAFDSKLHGMKPEDFTITAKGSKEQPLVNEEDGMLSTIVNMAERDGTLNASIEYCEGSKIEKIDSSQHPRVLVIPQIINNIASTVYNAVRTLFSH